DLRRLAIVLHEISSGAIPDAQDHEAQHIWAHKKEKQKARRTRLQSFRGKAIEDPIRKFELLNRLREATAVCLEKPKGRNEQEVFKKEPPGRSSVNALEILMETTESSKTPEQHEPPD
ncbi:2779_t:CDS:2, partial [Acaulospora colombiana]